MNNITFNLVGQCNLRCPTCPSTHISVAGGLSYASLELCESVFSHIANLYGAQKNICLFSLSEPLLHPHMTNVLSLAGRYGHGCSISSNLNVAVDWEALFAEPALKKLDISLSGFTQKTYGKGHCGGKIALVRKNMEAIARQSKQCAVAVKYLLYNDNLHEVAMARNICAAYGFQFTPVPAYIFYCGDTILAYGENRAFTLPKAARLQERRLLAPRLSEVAPTNTLAALGCSFQQNHLHIHCTGELHVCCLATNKEQGAIGYFPAMNAEEIAEAKQRAPFCALCKKNGLHVQWGFLSQLAAHALSENGAPGDDAELSRKWRRFLAEGVASEHPKDVVIYGAGYNGLMAALLFQEKGLRPIAFMDDHPSGVKDAPLPVYTPGECAAKVPPGTPVVFVMNIDKAQVRALKETLGALGVTRTYTFAEFIQEAAA